jgi:biotin transport system substrate-specific component
MTAIAPAAPRLVLADRVLGRSLPLDIVLVAAGTALTAVAAQIAVPLWPVPVTLQTLAVLLVAVTLGPIRASASMALYLVLGVVGLPIFAEGKSGSLFALTSGGFIVGFILSALLVGWLAKRAWDRQVLGAAITFLSGTVVFYLVGLPWLYVSLDGLGPAVWQEYLGYDSVLAATFGAGLVPFIVGDVAKIVVAASILPLAWWGADRAQRRSAESDAV